MKKLLTYFLTIAVALQAIAGVGAQKAVAAAPTIPSVIISELLWGGSEQSPNDAWLELYNTSGSSVDLTGWKLKNAGDGARTIVLSGAIASRSFFLVSRFAETNPSTVLNVTPDFVTNVGVLPKLELTNNCPAGGLLLTDSADTTIDAVPCNGSNWFAGVQSGSRHQAMERKLTARVSSDPTNWYSAEGDKNFDSGVTTTNGTPRSLNDRTAPKTGVVNDGPYIWIDWDLHNNKHWAAVRYDEFFDFETGIDHYLIAIGSTPGASDVIGFTPETRRTTRLKPATDFVSGVTYYATVKAVNGAGMVSAGVTSDGVKIETTKPLAPASATVADVANDNGTALQVDWTASASTDGITYRVDYRQVGGAMNSIFVGAVTSYKITGLTANTDYEVYVTAIDYSTRKSPTISALPSPVKTVDNGGIVGGASSSAAVAAGSTRLASSTTISQISTADEVVVTTEATDAPNKISTGNGIINDIAKDPEVLGDTQSDWTRIIVVAILLLVVAGGFYSLSRSFSDEGENTAVKKNGAAAAATVAAAKKPSRKTSKKAKRG